MFMSLLSHILIGYFCFALPSFATYKALSHRPFSEPDLQRWATYWAVVGAFSSVETAFEFFISWLPFYWEIKTAFLLFLALPQTEGSTYIYNVYLQPFYKTNEADLDRGIGQIQRNTVTFLQARLAALFDIVMRLMNKGGAPQSQQSAQGQQPNNPLGTAMNMFKAYSSSVNSGAQPRAPASPNMQSRNSGVSPVPSPLPTPHEPIGGPNGPYGMQAPVTPSFPEPKYD